MSITLELTPEEEQILRSAAITEGKDVPTLIRHRVFGTASNVAPPVDEATQRRLRAVDGHVDPNGRVYRVAEALALIDNLHDPGASITDEQWEAFKRGIDEARPGQRSIFGEGINPMSEPSPDDESVEP